MEGVWRCMVEWANLGRGRTELVRKCTDRTDPYGPSRPKIQDRLAIAGKEEQGLTMYLAKEEGRYMSQ
ncbi:hypothetical protein YC2023_060460 [Brassica napus]